MLHAAGQRFPDGTSIWQGQFENNQPLEGTLTKPDGTSREVEYSRNNPNKVFSGEKPKPRGTGSARKKDRDPAAPPVVFGPEVANPNSSASLAEGPIGARKRSVSREERDARDHAAPLALEGGASKCSDSRAASPVKKAKPGPDPSSVDSGVEEKLQQLKSWHDEGLVPEQAWNDAAADLLRIWARGKQLQP
jgi:hypothetical protein